MFWWDTLVHIYKCKFLSTFPQVRGQGKTGLDFEEAYNVSASSSSDNYSYADHLYIEPRTLEQMRLTVEQNWRRMKSRRSVLWERKGRRRRRRTEEMIGGDQKPKVLSKNSECIVQCTLYIVQPSRMVKSHLVRKEVKTIH